ncbi:MAG: TolC family outer membrane protein [Gammaproteobacteria bacterium]|nr:TolC family outer membrane protein [Gammaproteobacteria bacterium]MDH3535032.1 TolC family outer membrane protein [Gammaproteobacteria bacterium]
MNSTTGRGQFSTTALTAGLLALLLGTPLHALEMSDMVVDSISAHPEVKEKIHVYRQVASDRNIAESGWRPSVDLEASTGIYDTQSPATGNQSVDYDSTTLELSVTQNLFNGYDTTYQLEQTEARVRAALYDVYDIADNIALRAIQTYLELLKQRRLYQLAIENVRAHEEILAQIRDRNLSGVGRRSQLQQTEGRLARAQASLIAQQNNLEDTATQLHQILGRYVDPQSLSEPKIPPLPREDLDLLIDQALADHPAMRVAESNVAAAQADHRRSLRSRYPNLDLRLATEYGNDIGGLPGDTEETSLVLNLSYNFYSGGREQAERQKKISAVYEQKEFAARVRRQVINTLRLSWIADDLLVKQLNFLEAHVIKAGQTVESYKEEFFIGQRDLVDLLDAENEANSARNQYAEARFDALGARYRVYEGIGRLFEAAEIEFELKQGNLKIARLATDKVDRLPIPKDEDTDREFDPLDHCDNSRQGLEVNAYGCHESAVVSSIEPVAPKQNSTPVLHDDEFEIETNGILIITPAQLLANDSDADSDLLEIVDVSQPEVGRLAFSQKNSLVYRPVEGFLGIDVFKYTVTDNKGASTTATASVKIKVREPEIVSLSKVQLVNFAYDEAELTEISKTRVQAIIEQIKLAKDITVEIYTYTDNIGSDAYNLRLSERRAQALRNLLIRNGIDSADIKAVGMGEQKPIADNSTQAGQAINRRGEFIFKAKTAAE